MVVPFGKSKITGVVWDEFEKKNSRNFKIKINNSIVMKKVFLTKNQNYLPYNNFNCPVDASAYGPLFLKAPSPTISFNLRSPP